MLFINIRRQKRKAAGAGEPNRAKRTAVENFYH